MATENNSTNNNDTNNDGLEFHLGFQRAEALVRAVPVNDLESINLELTSTISTVIGAYPEIVVLRKDLADLKTFDVSQVDHLRDYALALAHLHGDYRAAGGDTDNVGDLAAECLELRDRLHTDATALAKRELLDGKRVAKLRGGNGYRMIAFDIVGLVGLFLEKWDSLAGKTAVEMAELELARSKASRLVTALGLRTQASPPPAELTTLRHQAYTLLVRAYNDTREAIAFVRRKQGDVDDIAPSLYAGRGRRSTNEELVVPAPVVTPEPEPDTELETTTAPTAVSVPVGFPGSSPIKAK